MDEGGRGGPAVDQVLDARAHPLRAGGPTRGIPGRAGERVHVDAGVGFEPQGAGDAVEDLVGGVPVAALFQTQVVLGADAGEEGDLLPAQTGHPSAVSGGQSHIPRAHLFAAGSQVVTQLACCCHESQGRSRRLPHPVPVGTRGSGAWSGGGPGPSVNRCQPQAFVVRLRHTTPRKQK